MIIVFDEEIAIVMPISLRFQYVISNSLMIVSLNILTIIITTTQLFVVYLQMALKGNWLFVRENGTNWVPMSVISSILSVPEQDFLCTSPYSMPTNIHWYFLHDLNISVGSI